MTLDYTKMFLIVTEEAVVKGHFTSMRKMQFVSVSFILVKDYCPVHSRWCSAGLFVAFC